MLTDAWPAFQRSRDGLCLKHSATLSDGNVCVISYKLSGPLAKSGAQHATRSTRAVTLQARMTNATFRFYARLNKFLPAQRRGQAFTCMCAEAATIKHLIEALGVPHTEVALVLVNGHSVGFDRPLQDQDQVAVYPRFKQLNTGSLECAKPLPPGPPRFVADAHLGGLARLLRMAGFDTLYDNHYEDAAMAAMANRENRVLLTRDRALLMHRVVIHGCYVHAVKPKAQLRELYQRFDLVAHAKPFSLCMSCNSPLQAVDKQAVLDRLPPRVQARHERFLRCDECDRIFWEGTHWQDMRALLDTLTRAEWSGL